MIKNAMIHRIQKHIRLIKINLIFFLIEKITIN